MYEELLVEQCGPDVYEILASPGLVLGVAAGDTIRTSSPDRFEVITRGRNLCVQLFRRLGLDELEAFATKEISRIHGRLDGKSTSQLVYTIGVSVGFAVIEQLLKEIVKRFPDAEWYYGNVYDPADGVTPLNWWSSPS